MTYFNSFFKYDSRFCYSYCTFFISSVRSTATTHWRNASWCEFFDLRRAFSGTKQPRYELWAFIAATILKWPVTMIWVKRGSSTESGVDKVAWWFSSSSFFPFYFLLSLTRIFKARVGNTDRELFAHYRMNSFLGHRSFIRNRK